ncbi:glycerophosphodiester phosphodiesterase [Tomitella gaofuii]|uniref:glycerophosphodiester phosphodiesterase n=1 Tax=Tomitella gaofuii TaxID=2760083 RepID=UPI0015F98DD1|nr:glycerophosphodiester phosphodiesterase [Tomitella gaofuii]
MTGGLPRIVAHRGSSALRAEHTLAAYELALEQGADGLECDVRLTVDGHLVCIHDRTVDRTSDGTGVVSEMTMREFDALDFAQGIGDPERVLELSTLIALALDHERPVKLFIETKHPVRFGGLVEERVLQMLGRYGLASPPSATHARAVVMSFSPAAVWRVRRAAPLLPTVLLGDASGYLGGSASTTVGATAVGPSIKRLRADPEIVDRAAAAGRATYCWTVDEPDDVALCRELGVDWIATNTPGRARRLLES